MHCHFRRGPLLEEVLPVTAAYARWGVAMPNTRPRAILEASDVAAYHGEIMRALDRMPVRHPFEPIMTIEIRDTTTPQMIKEARKAGAVAGKVYPLGVTTNSDEGLRDFRRREIQDTFRAMQDEGMLLLLHGELDLPRTLVTQREEVFLPTLRMLADKFRDLKIVLEHISTRKAVQAVKQLGKNVAATITAHHLCLTLNDVIGHGIQPHHGCNPMPKDFSDLDALIAAATSGDPKFFLGSDTAPHPRERKECAVGACGVYSAPVLPQVLLRVFGGAGCSRRLKNFASVFGPEFYGLPPTKETITLIKSEWVVPPQIGSVVPFCAGNKFQWQLAV